MAVWTGKLTSALYSKHTISSPAFMSLMICMPDGEDLDFFASGKLAATIEKMAIPIGSTITVNANDHQIATLVVKKEKQEND